MFDVNDFVQEDILIPIRFALGIHGFGDGICSESSDFAIKKFNIINTRVYNGIVMGTPNDVSLSVVLVADYGAMGKGGAT